MARCIITGCALVDLERQRWAWGDLYEEGDCVYIFNTAKEQQWTLWHFGPAPNTKALMIAPLVEEYFDMYGVIVIAKSQAHLNHQAREYIAS